MFTTVTRAPGSGGGLLNAIVGSLIQTGIGTLIGTPIGLLVGTYLAEYAAGSRLGDAVRFVSDVLLSAPSILIGLFVYQLLVAPFGGFSGWAGAVALAVIVIPIVVRTTEDMLRLIPVALREAAIALGAPKWKAIVLVCYRAALDGILTGVLLAIARVAGETAPLLFTSLGNLELVGSTWPADVQPAGDDLPVCRLRLRRLGAAGLDRRAADHLGVLASTSWPACRAAALNARSESPARPRPRHRSKRQTARHAPAGRPRSRSAASTSSTAPTRR